MYQTIQMSSCVSVQGVLVEALPNGEAIVQDGGQRYRGRRITAYAALSPASDATERADTVEGR